MSDRKFHPKLRMFDGNWYGMPTFYTDTLMRVGRGIPSAFWKMSAVVIRKTLHPVAVPGTSPVQFSHPYAFEITARQWDSEHGVNTAAVQDWSNAYSVSGLYSLIKGQRKLPATGTKPTGNSPTVWRYNTAATQADWLAFVVALRNVVRPTDRKKVIARRGTDDGVVASHAFKFKLALEVDRCRATVNGTVGPALPPVNTTRIEKFVEWGYADKSPDGSYTIPVVRPDRSRFAAQDEELALEMAEF